MIPTWEVSHVWVIIVTEDVDFSDEELTEMVNILRLIDSVGVDGRIAEKILWDSQEVIITTPENLEDDLQDAVGEMEGYRVESKDT